MAKEDLSWTELEKFIYSSRTLYSKIHYRGIKSVWMLMKLGKRRPVVVKDINSAVLSQSGIDRAKQAFDRAIALEKRHARRGYEKK